MGRKRLSKRHSIIFYFALGIIGAFFFLPGCQSVDGFLQLFLTPQYETDLQQLERVRALIDHDEYTLAFSVNQKLADRYQDSEKERNDYVRMITVFSRINQALLEKVIADKKEASALLDNHSKAIKSLEKKHTETNKRLAAENKKLKQNTNQLELKIKKLTQQIKDFKAIDLGGEKS